MFTCKFIIYANLDMLTCLLNIHDYCLSFFFCTATNILTTEQQVEIQGLTNIIKFDHQGFRTDFVLDIIELSTTGLRKVGQWNSTRGVNFTRSYGDHQKEIVEYLQNKTLIVTTILVSMMKVTLHLLFSCLYMRGKTCKHIN